MHISVHSPQACVPAQGPRNSSVMQRCQILQGMQKFSWVKISSLIVPIWGAMLIGNWKFVSFSVKVLSTAFKHFCNIFWIGSLSRLQKEHFDKLLGILHAHNGQAIGFHEAWGHWTLRRLKCHLSIVLLYCIMKMLEARPAKIKVRVKSLIWSRLRLFPSSSLASIIRLKAFAALPFSWGAASATSMASSIISRSASRAAIAFPNFVKGRSIPNEKIPSVQTLNNSRTSSADLPGRIMPRTASVAPLKAYDFIWSITNMQFTSNTFQKHQKTMDYTMPHKLVVFQ